MTSAPHAQTRISRDAAPRTPLTDEPHHPEITGSRLLAAGAVWDVREDTFCYPAGGDEQKELTRHYVDHTGAVMVVLIERDASGVEHALLIQQYRHPIGMREWELPGGLIDQPGEPPLLTAQRELAEETGHAADTWNVLLDTATTPGGNTELIRIFLARGPRRIDTDFVPEGEEADMQQRWVPVPEILAAIFDGRVHNGPLLHGILAYAQCDPDTLAPGDHPWERRRFVRGTRSGAEFADPV